MLALDHIVISSPETYQVTTKSGKKISIKTVKGGEHKEWGTYNYLSHFSNNSYLELLGIDDEQKARNSANPLVKHLVHTWDNDWNGPFQFALRTKNMDSHVNHFDRHDIPYHGPVNAQRQKPDGTILNWRMLLPEYDYTKETLPFLIEWEKPGEVFSENNLSNAQSITKVNYGSLDKPTFSRIYQFKPKKLNKNQVNLVNSIIQFTGDGMIDFELV